MLCRLLTGCSIGVCPANIPAKGRNSEHCTDSRPPRPSRSAARGQVELAIIPESEQPPTESEFSLFVGAPFWRLLRYLKLIGAENPLPQRRIVCLLLLTWIPLLVLTLRAGTALGNSVRIPLLCDISLYGRLVVALPLLILAEGLIDPRLRRVGSTFRNSGIVKGTDFVAYRSILAKVERLRDSGWAEAILVLSACFPSFLFVEEESLSSTLATWYHTPAGFSPAGWWYLLVSTSIGRFILYRWLWRYALWCILLYRIAKLDLNMMPTHPDEMGGLGFVVRAQMHSLVFWRLRLDQCWRA